jgi:hypothetical protein
VKEVSSVAFLYEVFIKKKIDILAYYRSPLVIPVPLFIDPDMTRGNFSHHELQISFKKPPLYPNLKVFSEEMSVVRAFLVLFADHSGVDLRF